MKKLLLFLPLLLIGCAAREKYVKVVDTVQPKSVMIEVKAVTMKQFLVIDETGIHVEEATVTVRVRGSGVFISPEGHVLTCAHLLWFEKVIDVVVIELDGSTYKAEPLFQEDRLDLALLKINTDHSTPYAKIADPRKLRVGQEVIAVGNPLGFEFSVTHGIISQLYRDGLGVPNMTQSDCFLNPGNSGGPLFNLKGELIGINSRIVPPVNANIFTGLGFSVQSGQIIEFLTRFRGLDRAIPPYDLSYWRRFLYGRKLGTR
jgi:S1-C subfamily serine protease